MDLEQFLELENNLKIKFNRQELLTNAFVHRSYLNEDPTFLLPSNERLEFLGDACLELIVSEHLYQTYPNEPEGVLTNYRSSLVNTQSLAETAHALNLGKYLLMSKGEEEGGGRNSEHLLANTFEALIGAIYLDQGFNAAAGVIKRFLLPKLPAIIKAGAHRDAKSLLQEIAQEKLSTTPHYQVLGEWGPDHNKNFKVGVYFNNHQMGEGIGASKQKAEITAAEDALEHWEKN